MTVNEVIKTLEEHIERTKNIKYGARKMILIDTELLKYVLDLINCQQAENEGLQKLVNLSIDTQNDLIDKLLQAEEDYKTAKAEAVKEFLSALQESNSTMDKRIVSMDTIYNLVKERASEN